MGKLKDDQLKWILSLDAGDVQGEINNLSSSIRSLEKENIALAKNMKTAEKEMKSAERIMQKLTKAGKTNTEAYRNAQKQYIANKQDVKELSDRLKQNKKAVDDNSASVKKLEQEMKLEYMTMAQLRKRAKQLQIQLDKTSASANPNEYKKLGTQLDATKKQMGKLSGKNKSLLQTMAGFHNPVGSAAQAILGFGQALKTIWKSNPILIFIMAVVAAFYALYKAIGTSEEATNKLNQILAPLKVLFDAILNITQKLVIVMLDFIQLAIKGFTKMLSLLPLVGGYMNEINEKAQEGIELEKRKHQLAINNRKMMVSNAKKELEILKLRNKAKRRDLYSEKERLGFLDKALELEKSITEEKVQHAKEELAIAEAEAARAGNNKETNDELARKRVAVINAEKELYQKSLRIESEKSSTILEMQRTNEKAYKDSIDRKVNYYDTALQKEITLLKNSYASGQITKEEYNRKEQEATRKNLEEKLKIQGLSAEKRLDIESQLTEMLLKEHQKRESILNNSQTEINIEIHKHNEKLKQAGIFGKKSKDLTTKQLNERLKLEKELQKKLLQISIDAENKRFQTSKADAGVDVADPSNLQGEKLKAYELLQQQHEANIQKIKDDSQQTQKQSQEQFDADILSAMQRTHQAVLNTIDEQSKQKQANLKQQLANGLITEKEYNEKIEKVEENSLTNREQAKLKYLVTLLSIPNPTELELKEIKKTEDEISKINNEKNEKRIQEERNFQQKRKQLLQQYGLTTIKEQYEAELQALKEANEKKLLSDEEYEQAKMQLKLQKANDYIQQSQQFIQAGANAVKAMEESETAKVQTEYTKRHSALQQQLDEGIISQEQYNEQKQQLDYEQKVEELEVQKKYADANFAMQVAQIAASTAQGVVNAWASSMILGPIAGPIAASALTAVLLGTAGMQIAKAKSERDRVKSLTIESPGGGQGTGDKNKPVRKGKVVLKEGFAEGGYTGDGEKYEVAGYLPTGEPYHKGEYFVAQEEMKNPEVVPLVRKIEQVRRRRTTSNPLPIGYADGGYTQSQRERTEIPTSFNVEAIERFERAVEKFEKAEIKAVLNYWEFKSTEKKAEKIKQLAQR